MPVYRAGPAHRVHLRTGLAVATGKLAQPEQQHDTEAKVDGHYQLGQAERETAQR